MNDMKLTTVLDTLICISKHAVIFKRPFKKAKECKYSIKYLEFKDYMKILQVVIGDPQKM